MIPAVWIVGQDSQQGITGWLAPDARCGRQSSVVADPLEIGGQGRQRLWPGQTSRRDER